MEELHTWLFDIFILFIIVLSSMLAYSRGLMREMMALVVWVGSFFIALRLMRPFVEMISPYVDSHVAIVIFCFFVPFFFSAIVLSWIYEYIKEYLHSGDHYKSERYGGFAFGLFRGLLLVSLAYLLVTVFVPYDNLPYWLKDAKTRKVMASGAHIIEVLSPEDMASLQSLRKGNVTVDSDGNLVPKSNQVIRIR